LGYENDISTFATLNFNCLIMKKSSIIGIIIIAIAIGVIVSTYADSSSYGSFNDAKLTETELHVVGQLNKGKQLVYDPQKDANYFAFYLVDNKGKECKVVFNGSKPQDFEKSEQIVLTGKMVGDEFHASKILMKCPSKYTKDEVEVKEFTTASAKI
jgi:cytochrome c-type biogenesis protein CcmE